MRLILHLPTLAHDYAIRHLYPVLISNLLRLHLLHCIHWINRDSTCAPLRELTPPERRPSYLVREVAPRRHRPHLTKLLLLLVFLGNIILLAVTACAQQGPVGIRIQMGPTAPAETLVGCDATQVVSQLDPDQKAIVRLNDKVKLPEREEKQKGQDED